MRTSFEKKKEGEIEKKCNFTTQVCFQLFSKNMTQGIDMTEKKG
jgi:hypothetical protein